MNGYNQPLPPTQATSIMPPLALLGLRPFFRYIYCIYFTIDIHEGVWLLLKVDSEHDSVFSFMLCNQIKS